MLAPARIRRPRYRLQNRRRSRRATNWQSGIRLDSLFPSDLSIFFVNDSVPLWLICCGTHAGMAFHRIGEWHRSIDAIPKSRC